MLLHLQTCLEDYSFSKFVKDEPDNVQANPHEDVGVCLRLVILMEMVFLKEMDDFFNVQGTEHADD